MGTSQKYESQPQISGVTKHWGEIDRTRSDPRIVVDAGPVRLELLLAPCRWWLISGPTLFLRGIHLVQTAPQRTFGPNSRAHSGPHPAFGPPRAGRTPALTRPSATLSPRAGRGESGPHPAYPQSRRTRGTDHLLQTRPKCAILCHFVTLKKCPSNARNPMSHLRLRKVHLLAHRSAPSLRRCATLLAIGFCLFNRSKIRRSDGWPDLPLGWSMGPPRSPTTKDARPRNKFVVAMRTRAGL